MAGKRKASNGGAKTYQKKARYTKKRSYARTYRNDLARPETKYFDTGINIAVTATATTWADTEVLCDNYINTSGAAAAYTDACLIPTAVGAGYGQVNGNRYKLKKLRARGSFFTNIQTDQADALNAAQVRMLMVMDKQPNGAQVQGEDVMQDIGDSLENIHAYYKTSTNSGRFKILKDERFVLQPAAIGTDGANTNSITFETGTFDFTYKPKKPLLVNIKAGNAVPTIAGTVDCNIFLLLFGLVQNVGAAVSLSAACRAYYCD